jgi:tetratricopeptide (TPR) repeat protein
MFEWLNGREAAAVGSALADRFAPRNDASNGARGKDKSAQGTHSKALQQLLQQADREVRGLGLNFIKRAKLANSFKWRLLENGVQQPAAEEVTRALVVHLMLKPGSSESAGEEAIAPADAPAPPTAHNLLTQGNKHFAEGAFAEALSSYQELVKLKPRHADGLNNLGAVLCKLNRYPEAEEYFRRALQLRPDNAEAHSNLGSVLRWKGQFPEAEASLRRALKLKPDYVDARNLLALTLAASGRMHDAKAQFEKVLKNAPRHTEALLGLAQVATIEGRFDDAEALFKRTMQIEANKPGAWAGLVGLRRMSSADGAWLTRAEEIAAGGIPNAEEASMRFAIGKYYDDVGDFVRAFQSYRRGNELLRELAENYQRDAHTRFVDDLIRVYTPQSLAQAGGASESMTPVFVVGMLRSGTSLTEQIIASHPAAIGAGELSFWGEAVRKHVAEVRRGILPEPVRKKLADEYLKVLSGYSADALRVVDKSPVNADHLGLIYSVFPKARIIYMQRDPIDTCLSCYFQQFPQILNFTTDLSDLAHYYREHHRLMAHWRAVLPAGTILDVPYEQLIGAQELWTRRILEFIGLSWDQRCLDFHKTERPVTTASYWQVRQKIYNNSVERWRNYKKFIKPLLELHELA